MVLDSVDLDDQPRGRPACVRDVAVPVDRERHVDRRRGQHAAVCQHVEQVVLWRRPHAAGGVAQVRELSAGVDDGPSDRAHGEPVHAMARRQASRAVDDEGGVWRNAAHVWDEQVHPNVGRHVPKGTNLEGGDGRDLGAFAGVEQCGTQLLAPGECTRRERVHPRQHPLPPVPGRTETVHLSTGEPAL